MCGACGSTVYPDSVMGNEHTLRKRMLVAHAVSAVCAGLPGAPRITALAEGWTVSGATGSISLCHTFGEIWLAVLGRGGLLLQQALEARALAEEPDPLAADVVSLGLRLTRQRLLDNSHSTQLIGA